MKIPQEIQDLMPEKREIGDDTYCKACGLHIAAGECECSGFNQALTEVEAVLPQMLALAEKRGAEGERERIKADIKKHMSLDGVSMIDDGDMAVPWRADEYQCAMRNALRLITPPTPLTNDKG